jgi:hypothetical protein
MTQLVGHLDSAVRPARPANGRYQWDRMPFQNDGTAADTPGMNLRTSTLDRIAGSFADAIASGDFEAAEGWMATARYVERRQADMRQASPRRLRPARRILFRVAG